MRSTRRNGKHALCHASVPLAPARVPSYSADVTRPADTTLPPWPLSERPGFLIRRLHQIHGALFAQACSGFDVTPVQYSLLSALAARGQADQTTLAADVALDRTTATGALKRLQARGLVERATSRDDRRAQACRLTLDGANTLSRMEEAARRAHHDTVAALSPEEQCALLQMLGQLVSAHEELVTD